MLIFFVSAARLSYKYISISIYTKHWHKTNKTGLQNCGYLQPKISPAFCVFALCLGASGSLCNNILYIV